jgi:transposase-like protein
MIGMTLCDYCGSHDVAKKGIRYNASGAKQKFFCHNCNKWFVIDDGFKGMRNKPEDIVRAIDQYGDGMSLKKVKKHLWQHDGVKVSRWGIRKWVVKYSRLLKKQKQDSALRRLRAVSTTTRNMSG